MSSLRVEVERRWNEADAVVSKDFGRLSSSLSILKTYSSGESKYVHSSNNRELLNGDAREKLSKMDECRVVLDALLQTLKKKNAKQKVVVGSSETAPNEIVETIKKKHPLIFRILRAVNQSVIMPAIFHLTLEVLQTSMPILDIPGPESWLCEIDVAPQAIIVRHLRRARSCSDTSSKNYFEFKWILSLTFDSEVKNMLQCELVVVDFRRGKNMKDEEAKRISSLLKCCE